MSKDEQTFGTSQLNNLKSIADELENHTCKHIIRFIFQESPEIERYPQVYRERFDIAFSQAVIIPIIYIYSILKIVFLLLKRLYNCLFVLVNLPHILYLCSSIVC